VGLDFSIVGGVMGVHSSNPIIGELVYTNHPSLPIMEILTSSKEGYLYSGKYFLRNTFAIVSEININMGKLIFEDGRTGWCNLCYIESVK